MADFKNILRIEAGFSQYELALGRVRYDLNILILLPYLVIVNTFCAAGVCRRHSKITQIVSKMPTLLNFIPIFRITMI